MTSVHKRPQVNAPQVIITLIWVPTNIKLIRERNKIHSVSLLVY